MPTATAAQKVSKRAMLGTTVAEKPAKMVRLRVITLALLRPQKSDTSPDKMQPRPAKAKNINLISWAFW